MRRTSSPSPATLARADRPEHHVIVAAKSAPIPGQQHPAVGLLTAARREPRARVDRRAALLKRALQANRRAIASNCSAACPGRIDSISRTGARAHRRAEGDVAAADDAAHTGRRGARRSRRETSPSALPGNCGRIGGPVGSRCAWPRCPAADIASVRASRGLAMPRTSASSSSRFRVHRYPLSRWITRRGAPSAPASREPGTAVRNR